MTEHSIFYVDFDDGSDRYAPRCGQVLRRRPGLSRLEPREEEELLFLRQELALLAASTRGGGKARRPQSSR